MTTPRSFENRVYIMSCPLRGHTVVRAGRLEEDGTAACSELSVERNWVPDAGSILAYPWYKARIQVEVDDYAYVPPLLPVGAHFSFRVAQRECEVTYPAIAQPLIVGRRLQLHKDGAVIIVYNNKGERISGRLKVGEDGELDLSSVFLKLSTMASPDTLIVNGVLSRDDTVIYITDILRYDDVATHLLPGKERMCFIDSIEWPEGVVATEHMYVGSGDDIEMERCLLRPARLPYCEGNWKIYTREEKSEE